MINLFRVATFFIILFFITTNRVYAESSYVLPYPSSMPGSLNYKLHVIFEKVSKYWYFGDFGQFDYSLKMSDKYLVEAKTLFEYKQYLLAQKALQKSDFYFAKIPSIVNKVKKNHKNIDNKISVFEEASKKHIEILEKIDIETPDSFIWRPEKSLPTTLNIKDYILGSILLRKNNL